MKLTFEMERRRYDPCHLPTSWISAEVAINLNEYVTDKRYDFTLRMVIFGRRVLKNTAERPRALSHQNCSTPVAQYTLPACRAIPVVVVVVVAAAVAEVEPLAMLHVRHAPTARYWPSSYWLIRKWIRTENNVNTAKFKRAS